MVDLALAVVNRPVYSRPTSRSFWRSFEPAFPMDFCVLSGLYNEWPIQCESCLEQPCVVVQSKDFFIEAATKKLLENTSNKQVRFFLYRMFSQKINGYLGAKTRR